MLRDFVRETANNPGSSATINLIGPVTGRQSFVSAFGSGATVYYTMEDGAQWEVGAGTVTAGAPNTLTRTTVLWNSVGTTARLNFSGLTRVFNQLPAERVVALMPDAAAARATLGVPALPTASAGPGQIDLINPGVNTAYTVPAGGSWLAWRQVFAFPGGTYPFQQGFSRMSGGSVLPSPGAGNALIGWAWRVE
jgi:hypothetical protein